MKTRIHTDEDRAYSRGYQAAKRSFSKTLQRAYRQGFEEGRKSVTTADIQVIGLIPESGLVDFLKLPQPEREVLFFRVILPRYQKTQLPVACDPGDENDLLSQTHKQF